MGNDFFDEIRQLENRLDLPDGFYQQIVNDDDWSFVIKLNALFEAASAHALSDRLNSPEIVDALARLDLANSKFGKAKLLRDLKVISKQQEAFIRALAELRNDLVHNISNVTFSFKSRLSSFDDNQIKKFAREFGYQFVDPIVIQGVTVSRTQFVRENPKLVIWLSAADVIACLQLEREFSRLRIQRLALDEFAKMTGRLSADMGLLTQGLLRRSQIGSDPPTGSHRT